jgi:lysophospholipase L1-like esterase
MKKMVEHTNGRYLIISVHTLDSYHHTLENEAALEAQFGDRFFNWRKYVSSNALEDFGVTPSADDLTYMAEGKFPPSFWRSRVGDAGGGTANDGIHMNASAYAILAYKVKERLEQIGLI